MIFFGGNFPFSCVESDCVWHVSYRVDFFNYLDIIVIVIIIIIVIILSIAYFIIRYSFTISIWASMRTISAPFFSCIVYWYLTISIWASMVISAPFFSCIRLLVLHNLHLGFYECHQDICCLLVLVDLY